MTPETQWILGTGAAIVVAILSFMWLMWQSLDKKIDKVQDNIGDLRERMTRLEGAFEGFTRKDSWEQRMERHFADTMERPVRQSFARPMILRPERPSHE